MRTGWRQNTISRLLPLALLAACDATSSSAALTAADAGGDGALGQCIGVKTASCPYCSKIFSDYDG